MMQNTVRPLPTLKDLLVPAAPRSPGRKPGNFLFLHEDSFASTHPAAHVADDNESDDIAVLRALLPSRVDERVHNAMNKWIAETQPPIALNREDTFAINSNLKFIWIGLQWDVISTANAPCELGIVAFCLDRNGVCKHKKEIVYWGNQTSALDALTHKAEGKPGDDETLKLSLYQAKVGRVQEVVIFVNIRDGRKLGQSFSNNVRRLKCTCYDKFGGRYRDFAYVIASPPFAKGATNLEVARLKFQDDAWQFRCTRSETTAPLKQIYEKFCDFDESPDVPKKLKGETQILEAAQMAQTVVVGFSWMVVKPRRGPRAKVYVVVAMLDANGRLAKPLITDANNKCPGIVLQDKGFGSGDSQMESQAVDLQLKSIPDAISDVVVIAILDDASQAAGQGFESITSGTVQLSTRQSSDKSLSALCMHSLPWRLSAATCVELGRFTRQKDNSFSKFKFTSQGVRSDHKSMVNDLQNGLFLSKRAIEGVKCGDRLGITKACPGIETFNVACGWRNPEEPLDLDILASAVAKDGKLLNHKDFVYWNNKQNPSETVKLTADARAREEGTSEEAVQLDLEDIPDRIYSIIFMLSIHKAKQRNQTFQFISEAWIRMFDAETDQHIFRYYLEMTKYQSATAIELGRLEREGNGWIFRAQTAGMNCTLKEIKTSFSRHTLEEGACQVVQPRSAVIGLGWDVENLRSPQSEEKLDVDVMVVGLTAADQVFSKEWFVYYENLKTPCSSIVHNGDARDGDGNKEDDETVILNLKTFEERVHKILVFINVYEAKERGHELSLCSALYVRVFDQDNREELLRYDVDTSDLAGVPTVEVAQLTRLPDNQWTFTALGRTLQDDIDSLIKRYNAA